MGCHEGLQLPDERRVPSELELCLDQVFLRRDAELVEPRSHDPGEVQLVEVGERGAAPELEPLAQQPRPRRRLRVPRLLQQPLEAVAVDGLSRHGKPVAGRLRHENVPPDQLPQRRDGVLQRPDRRRGRGFPPEVGDETVGRDDLTGAQRQRGEQRTLLPARQRDDPVAVPDLQRAEEADLHRRVVTPRTSKANPRDEPRMIAA